MEEELYDYINPKLREIQTVRASIRTILFNAWTRYVYIERCVYDSHSTRREEEETSANTVGLTEPP